MAKVKYGELSSWGDADVSMVNDFMKLEEGINKVRIFTNPFQFVVHWVEDASGQNRKIKCAIENCPLCRKGVKAQTRWYIGVLDYKSGQPKILEVGSQIFNSIHSYATDEEWGEKITKPWGEIFAYDIAIMRGPKGTNPLYSVQPSPKMKDIKPEETAFIEEFLERVDISKFTEPLAPEDIEEKLGITEEKPRVSVGNKTVDLGTKTATVSEDEFSFDDDDLD